MKCYKNWKSLLWHRQPSSSESSEEVKMCDCLFHFERRLIQTVANEWEMRRRASGVKKRWCRWHAQVYTVDSFDEWNKIWVNCFALNELGATFIPHDGLSSGDSRERSIVLITALRGGDQRNFNTVQSIDAGFMKIVTQGIATVWF